MPNGGTISSELVDAIANSTAVAVGEQPAILANLALANQIANSNLAQQNAISNQQAMFHLELTIVSKCVEMIANINPTGGAAAQQIEAFQKIMEMFAQMSQKPGGGAQPTPQPGGGAPPPPAPPPPPDVRANAVKASAGTKRAGAGAAKSKRLRRPGKNPPPTGQS